MPTRRQFLQAITLGVMAEWFLPALSSRSTYANLKEVPFYLTFDDGVETVLAQGKEGATLEVLDILDETEVPATFFVHGRNTSLAEGEVLARMLNSGHIVANHSYMQGGVLLEYEPTPSYMARMFLDTELKIREVLAA